MRPIYLLLAALYSIFLFGCSGGGGGGDTTPPARVLTSIAVTGAETSYIVGQQDTIDVTGSYDNGQSAVLSGVTWTSSNPAVASINASGVINALSVGSTSITASAQGFTSPAFNIDIIAPSLTSIAIAANASSIPVGLDLQLSAQGTFDNGNTSTIDNVSWSSSDDTIVTITNEGLVSAVSVGSVTINAEQNGISANFSLTITAAELQSINIQISDASTALGTTTQAQAFGTFTDNSTNPVSVVWSSSDEQVATINAQGLITGVGVGQTTITGVSGSISSNSASVTISDAIVTGLDTSPMFTNIPSGLQEQLGATLLFSDNSTQAATDAQWTSSDESVATVSSTNGVATITAVAEGSSEISASSNGFTSSFTVNTVAAVVTDIEFNTTSVTLPEGESEALSVIANLSDNSTNNVTSSSAFSVSDAQLGSFAAPNATAVTFTAGQQGTGSISASFSTFTSVIDLEVTPAVPVAVLSATPTLEIAAGLSSNTSITVEYSDGSELTPVSGVSWSVSDNSIATVSATGTATASIMGVSEGSTTVTATFDGLSFVFTINITAAEPLTVSFSLPTIYSDDENVQLTATATFTDGSDADVTDQVVWASSDTSIATVSNDSASVGRLTPIGEGEVSITASFSDSAISNTETTTIQQARILTGFSSYKYNSETSITIGDGDYALSVDFSDIDDQSASLDAVAGHTLAAISSASLIQDVSDTGALSFGATSVTLIENSGQTLAAVSNANGITAVIKVHEVKTFTNANNNLVMFSWAIRTDGGSDFSNYSVVSDLKLFECRELTSSCTELDFSYNANTGASVTFGDPKPANHPIGSFILIAIGEDYTITNLSAVDSTNLIVPSFDGLANNQVISEGDSAPFRLMVQPTNDESVFPTYRFNVDNNTSMSFTLMASFRSN